MNPRQTIGVLLAVITSVSSYRKTRFKDVTEGFGRNRKIHDDLVNWDLFACQLRNKVTSIQLKWNHAIRNLMMITIIRVNMICDTIPLQRLNTRRIQIVCINMTTTFCCWNGKRTDSTEHVNNTISIGKGIHETTMFMMQPRIPVYFTIIKRKGAISLLYLNYSVVFSGNHLHIKGPPRREYTTDFIDNRFTRRYFI